MMTQWLAAFFFTQFVEVPIYLFAKPQPRGWLRRFGVAFGASAVTHPIVWFVIPTFFMGGSYVTMAVTAEAFALLTEAAWLHRFGIRRPLAWSLLANASSVAIGLGLRALTGWV